MTKRPQTDTKPAWGRFYHSSESQSQEAAADTEGYGVVQSGQTKWSPSW